MATLQATTVASMRYTTADVQHIGYCAVHNGYQQVYNSYHSIQPPEYRMLPNNVYAVASCVSQTPVPVQLFTYPQTALAVFTKQPGHV